MSRSNLMIWLLLGFLADFVSMQEVPPAVAMMYPPRAREKHPKIYFDPGENVLFNWTSTFPWISLELYQGPRPDGHWVMVPLLTNVSNATHDSWNWNARVLPGMNRGHAFHLRLFNADDAECDRCHSNSSLFEIKQPDVTASNSSSPTESTTASESASLSADSTSASSRNLALGLGLGLGLPLVVFVTAFGTWLGMRRKRRGGGEDGASQSEVPLADWKKVCPEEENVKAEMQGQPIIELSSLDNAVEAPTNTDRAELDGNLGHAL